MKKSLPLVLSFGIITALLLYTAVSCKKTQVKEQLPVPGAEVLQTEATTITIVVRARGTNGTEHINLTVAGTVIGNWTLTTAYANYTATTTATGNARVAFDNDASGRDVQVDYI